MSDFVPTFQSVLITDWDGYAYPVAPMYCATDATANQLAGILSDLKPVVFQSTPLGWPSGLARASKTVPWLRFPDGTELNAGTLAWYWRPGHGGDSARAEAMCRQDIASAMANTARQNS